MHRFAAGQTTPHCFRFHRSKRCDHAHECFKHGVQRVERVLILVPETVTIVADVPVGEHVDEVGHGFACVRNQEVIQRMLRLFNQSAGTRQQITIHFRQCGNLIGTQRTSIETSTIISSVRIQGEEVVRAPHRQHNLANGVANAIGGHNQVAAAQNRRTHEEPTHGVGTEIVEHSVHIRVVAQMLRHLLAVGAKHDAVADHVLERRLVEQGGRHDVLHVEPATGLTDVFHDVIAREVLFERFLILERIMVLGEAHGTGFEPAVHHVGDAVHVALAGRIIRVDAGQFVDVRAVHVDIALMVARIVTEVGLQLLQRTVHVNARILRVVGNPHRNRGAPETVAGDRPVAGVGKPLAELAILHIARNPVDFLVQLKQTILDLGDGHEPRAHRLVDKRGGATPAVRVGVHVALLLEENRALFRRNTLQRTVTGTQVAQDRLVRIEHIHALVIRAQRSELAACVEHVHALDALGVERVHIVFAVRSLMHEAGTFNGVDIIGGEDLVAFRSRHLAFGCVLVASEVREHRVVAPAFHLGTLEFAHDLIVFAEFLGVGAEQWLAQVELLARELAFGRTHFHIVDVGTDHDGEVGGNGPRRGGPEHRIGVFLVAQLHGHGHGGVLTILIHVGVHAQLVRGKRRLILRAVRQHAVALICEALVVQLLERPHHGFHVWNVQRLVAMLEIDPTCLTVHVVLPLVGVLEHGGAAGIVELVDAHFLDLIDRIDAQFLLGFKLGRKTVRVPTEHTVDLVALHGLVARNHILGVAGQQVAVMRQTVGERRSVEEDEFVLAVIAGRTAFNGLLESIVLLPIIKDGFFQLRKTGVRCHISALLTRSCLRIHVVFAHRISS